jgi:hypothetical protein
MDNTCAQPQETTMTTMTSAPHFRMADEQK